MSLSSNLKSKAAFSLKTGGVLGTVAGIFSDLLMPLATLGLYIGAFFILVFAILLVVNVVGGEKLAQKFNTSEDPDSHIWFAPLGIALLLLSGITIGSYYVSTELTETNNGFIASHVPMVETLQKQLGMMEEQTKILKSQYVEQQKMNTSLTGIYEVTSAQLEIDKGYQEQNEEALNNPTALQYKFYNAIQNENFDAFTAVQEHKNWNNNYLERNAMNVGFVEELISKESPTRTAMLEYLVSNERWNPNKIVTLQYQGARKTDSFFQSNVVAEMKNQRKIVRDNLISDYKRAVGKEAENICKEHAKFIVEFDKYVINDIHTDKKPAFEYRDDWAKSGIPRQVLNADRLIMKYKESLADGGVGAYNLCIEYKLAENISKNNSRIDRLKGFDIAEQVCKAYNVVKDNFKEQYVEYFKEVTPIIKMEKTARLEDDPILSPFASSLKRDDKCINRKIERILITNFERNNREDSSSITADTVMSSGVQMAYIYKNSGAIELLEGFADDTAQHLIFIDNSNESHEFGLETAL